VSRALPAKQATARPQMPARRRQSGCTRTRDSSTFRGSRSAAFSEAAHSRLQGDTRAQSTGDAGVGGRGGHGVGCLRLCERHVAMARSLLSRHVARHRQLLRGVWVFRSVGRHRASTAPREKQPPHGPERGRQAARQLCARRALWRSRSHVAPLRNATSTHARRLVALHTLERRAMYGGHWQSAREPARDVRDAAHALFVATLYYY
jgi:hypothetical protein